MRVAVVGAGIAGLVVAHRLSPTHDVTVFEAADHAGGHAHTVEVALGGRTWSVDTGFVVFDRDTYPGFAHLLDELDVATQPAEMSFSVRCPDAGFEYSGRSLAALLAQPSNLVRPGFHRLVRDVLRFNRTAAATAGDRPVDAYLAEHGYSAEFRDRYLVPMVAAIWSARPTQVLAMPADWLVRFFQHHGLLRVAGQPQWHTVAGGASRYVDALTARLRTPVRLRAAVTTIRRHDDRVDVAVAGAAVEPFDRVVLAVHGSQALRLLGDPTPDERAVLGAFAEQANEGVLHTDISLLPLARRAWSSWNVHLGADDDPVRVTYDMSRLQRLASPAPLLVTLNPSDAVDPRHVLRRLGYEHPIFTRDAIAAQARHGAIDGVRRTHFCGAHWGWGFHEDGVESALAVCARLAEAA
jgi:uncharacterized protein